VALNGGDIGFQTGSLFISDGSIAALAIKSWFSVNNGVKMNCNEE